MNLINLLNNIPYSKNDVIVFDIDGTLLNKNGKIITETLEFYYYCLYKQYPIYIITARPGSEDIIYYTINNLVKEGVDNFEKIYFSNPDKKITTKPLVREYKKEVRKHIKNLGLNIIISIGDQDTDYDNNCNAGIKVIDDGKKLFRVI